MSQSIVVHEGERGYLDYTLTYSDKWSAVAKRGEPVVRADTTTVYFYVKTSRGDATAAISLSDDSASEIEWLDEDAGQIRVKLGTNTEGEAGDGQVYELRIKFSDGSFVTADDGTIDIIDSIVDTP